MFNKYTFLEIFRLFISFIYTKLFYWNSRLIRLPFDIRYRKNIYLGKSLTTGINCRIEVVKAINDEKVIWFGDNVQINDYVHITGLGSVVIGNGVLIASKVYISDCVHGSYLGDEFDSNPTLLPSERELFSKPVLIKDNVWIGEFVSVLPGVTIGEGTIVGANSVVSKNLPDYVIAVGSPAIPIKKFNFKNQRWEKIF
jgi:lipopolysaccharide O-acetyltransferase